MDWSLDHYVVSFLISCIFFILRSILSDMKIATLAFFCFTFASIFLEYIFPSSHFQFLGLKWVSCRQHIYGFCFCIYSASLCLLVGAFNPLTFIVIIDIYVPIAIFLIVWGWFCRIFYCISQLYVCLTFVVKLVWWYWIFLTFACLKSFLFLHQFSMRSLPGTVILVVDFSLSVL